MKDSRNDNSISDNRPLAENNNDRANSDDSLQDSPTDTPMGLFSVYLKGIAMGMADIVPGVSGGTIALIAGIYHRLISAISSVDIKLLRLWREHGLVKGFIEVWKHVDATFLLCLALGVGTSFITLAGIISTLLETQPLKIWSLFFGLVIATVFVLLTEIKQWTWQRVLLFVSGVVVAVGISHMPMVTGTPSLPYLFFAGAVAICAMILPGVSGSFILLLLGAYQAVLDAVHGRDFLTIAVVMAGMVTGLLIFSKFLKWLLSHFYQPTLAVLIGFIAGSLVKIYPWKVEIDGVMKNVAPSAYPTGAEWGSSLSLMLLGAVIVVFLSWIGRRHANQTKI